MPAKETLALPALPKAAAAATPNLLTPTILKRQPVSGDRENPPGRPAKIADSPMRPIGRGPGPGRVHSE
jgi:hypothetical protein